MGEGTKRQGAVRRGKCVIGSLKSLMRAQQLTHGDALDVVAQHLAVALGAALSETLATLATTRHSVS